MTVPNRMPLEDLLANAGWAKALARQLVRDEGSADDLVQRTWVAALEHPPELADAGAPATLRRWMASVMRNFARQDVRERERRVQRELQAARPEGTAEDVELGIEGQRKLLEVLRALPEPYRAALYARYFEGLMPREIARRDGVPSKTVKSRLARGLAEMRQRLDREHGGNRAAWLVWTVPMAAKSAVPTALLGALIVNSKLKLAGAVLIAALVLAVGGRFLRQEPSLPEVATTHAAEPVVLPLPEATKTETIDPSARAPVEVAANAGVHAEAPAPAPKVAGVVRGRVLDLDNRPVGGVRIVCEQRESRTDAALPAEEQEEVRSDLQGNFELRPRKFVDTNALVDDPRWVTVYKAYVAGETALEATIFVAPRRELSGVVLDPSRRPVEGAEVELRLDASIKRKLERRLDSAYRENFTAKTDAQGHFSLPKAPACAAELYASAPGWLPGTLAAPESSVSNLELLLGAREKKAALVRGIVQDSAGKPIEDANVGIGGLTMKTGSDGRFTFDLDGTGSDLTMAMASDGVWKEKYPRTHLRAVKRGLLPCELALPPIEELREDATSREFTLVLDGAVLSIRGTVVDAEGNPIAGARVTVLDETPFGPIYNRVGEASTAREVTIEELLRGGTGFSGATSANDGKFEVGGLIARKYDLAALDKRTLRYGKLRGVEAGSNVRLELAGDSTLAHVAGRIVSHAGEGLAGISLHVGRAMEMVRGGMDFARSLETDASGHFDLGEVATEGLRIQIVGVDIFLIMAWQPPAGAKLDELEIPVTQRCPFKVELTPSAPKADSFSFVDAAGAPTQNLRFEGPMLSLPERCLIVDGASEVLATEDTATTMLLFSAGKEIGRLPVHLVPGELTILRP